MAIGLDALPCGPHQQSALHTDAAARAMEAAWILPACPLRLRRHRLGRIDGKQMSLHQGLAERHVRQQAGMADCESSPRAMDFQKSFR